MPEQLGWRMTGEQRRDLVDEVHVTIECPRWVLTCLVEAIGEHVEGIREDDDPRLNRIADALESIDWTHDVVTWSHHMVPARATWDAQRLDYVSDWQRTVEATQTLSGASAVPPSDLSDDELGL